MDHPALAGEPETDNLFASKSVRAWAYARRKEVSVVRDVFVIACDGTRLMPTSRYRARKMLKAGKAVIYKHQPFTIRLNHASEKNTQPIELCMDTGSEHIGISVKSEKHEYVHAQYDNLPDEKEHHVSQSMYRRTRRNRLRYRKARFGNRRKPESWIAPSIEHKKSNHVRLTAMYKDVCPITSVVIEVGQFDPAALQAMEETGEVLQGTDYQHGKKYGLANLREAVFTRDSHTCQICGKSIKDNAILCTHHIIYRSMGGTDRLNNLLTVCDRCHTPKNHKPGGKLWGLKPVTRTLKDAAFMNIVRWRIVDEIQAAYPDIEVRHTYGSYTKAARRELGQLPKTHANDAYAMGELHPKHRHHEEHWRKRRRNNRCLAKFYDAKYIDIRDGSKKSGSQLSCSRTKRSVPRNNLQNERVFRGQVVSEGRVSIRKRRYALQPGDIVIWNRKPYGVVGIQNKGAYVKISNKKVVNIKNVYTRCHCNGWRFISDL